MVSYQENTIPLKRLLLDPNNFRFSSPEGVPDVADTRFGEETVQAAALERIKLDGVAELKHSISENGFVPVERIVVRELTGDPEQRFVVVEGNRRTAALKLLERDHKSGGEFKEEVTNIFEAVPVLQAADATSDDLLAIMGIRHVGGPKEWGGFQSAQLVYELLNKPELTARNVASRLGLTVNEVNRRYRAFGALSQMIEDEEYGDSVSSDMYPIFHETVGQPIVREWLGWAQQEKQFKNDNNRELFYSWLTAAGDGPKIRSYSEIRELRHIIENDDALVALKDDNQSFGDAIAIVRADAKAARWMPNATSALKSLNEMGSDMIESLEDEALTILADLKRRAAWIIKANALSSEDDTDEEA